MQTETQTCEPKVENCSQLNTEEIEFQQKLNFDFSSVSGNVEAKAKVLQEKYNLSDEQIVQIVNTLYCISENVITRYIKNKQAQIQN